MIKGVGAFTDELQRVQLEARLRWQLRNEWPVEVNKCDALVQSGV
jgi:hypothetical protein